MPQTDDGDAAASPSLVGSSHAEPAVDWPGGARSAVALTFDFDAESIWLANDPRHATMPSVLSLGGYGARVGVWKVLEFLRQESLPATFFVPGSVAEAHPDAVEAILVDGHEVAHHGYTHTAPDPGDAGSIERELDMGWEALIRVAGVVPRGHRAPDGIVTDRSLSLLTERDFLYDSSFKDHYLPYRHVLADGRPGPIELPEQPSLDDWAYGMVSPGSPGALYPKEAVLAIWRGEFEELHSWGGLSMLVMHPQVTGRPLRLATLREFVAATRDAGEVWYATCAQIAEVFAAQEGDDG